MIVLLLAACAWAPARTLAPAEHQDLFALAAHGRTLAGPAVVVHDDASLRLHALAPMGTEVFSVHVRGDTTTVRSADPALTTWLERMPFRRDLNALYRLRCDAPRCAGDGYRLRETPDGWRVRGPGGPATLTHDDLRWVLRDDRRGYTLTVAPGAAP